MGEMLGIRDEQKKVSWYGFIKIVGVTPMDRTENIVKIFEDLTQWLSNLGADMRLMLCIEDTNMMDENQSET
jgi:hypothetical protein